MTPKKTKFKIQKTKSITSGTGKARHQNRHLKRPKGQKLQRKQLPEKSSKFGKDNFQGTTQNPAKTITSSKPGNYQRTASNPAKNLSEKAPNPAKTISRKQLQIRRRIYQRTAPDPTKNLSENRTKPGKDNYQRTAPNPAKNLSEKAPNPAKTITREQLQIW